MISYPIFSNEFLVSSDGNCLFLLADCEGQLNKKKYTLILNKVNKCCLKSEIECCYLIINSVIMNVIFVNLLLISIQIQSCEEYVEP